ncbi:unnamed protein product [Ostreobium quekettii]|uniref:AAA+ ATPase domain-containing protein n=1 Tax=Ostreobium quekettii TaxID=121088 RepID=A0A8S1IMM8_9CHLO|nr:unnamed protein product [Ostreobium quekettii]|eukprot:evm.model.scf_535.8 EVM.evm.TU.scf_535.8   scf_535:57868-60963(-)
MNHQKSQAPSLAVRGGRGASPSLEPLLKPFVERLVRRVLLHFADFQDSLLSVAALRRVALYALRPRCFQALRHAFVRPSQLRERFDDIPYFVDDDARAIILQAAYLAWSSEAGGRGRDLASLGRVLIHTNADHSGKFQEAVARAAACELGAALLVVDAGALNGLALATLGRRLDAPAGQRAGEEGMSLAGLASWFLKGGRRAFVWDLVREFCEAAPGPIVLFVRDVEQTVCGSVEGAEAFVQALGAAARDAGGLGLPSRTVVVAGTSLREFGADRIGRPGEGDSSDDDPFGGDGSPFSGPSSNPSGLDDSPSILSELGWRGGGDRVDVKGMLAKLFTVRVSIQPPQEGPGAVDHRQQLARDFDDIKAEQNHACAFGVARSAGVCVPPADSRVYRRKPLSGSDWARVLSWAVSQELHQRRGEGEGGEPSAGCEDERALACGEEEASSAGSAREREEVAGTPGFAGRLRRGMVSRDGSMFSLEEVQKRLQFLAKPRDATLPQGEDDGFGGLAKSEQQGKHGGVSDREQDSTCDDDDLLEVGEGAVLYGLAMLDRCGVSRGQIKTDNSYERRLLSEVLRPGELGSGFADVGALSAAKVALREAVQLPLQHPELFLQGSLIRPSKGVLLFGPPGTGKTMLARAAAAECGASFLAIQPSSILSKWVGEGVRNVRALFSLAEKLSPCVLFCDELDAILGQRTMQEHEAMRELKNEFMSQWDGIRSGGACTSTRIMVLGATNRPQDIDEAVLRRFSHRIFCDLPTLDDRLAILKVLLSGEVLDETVDLKEVARMTDGHSGSDLRQFCIAAAMRPLREFLKEHSMAKEGKVAGSAERHQGVSKVDAASFAASQRPTVSSYNAADGHTAKGVESLDLEALAETTNGSGIGCSRALKWRSYSQGDMASDPNEGGALNAGTGLALFEGLGVSTGKSGQADANKNNTESAWRELEEWVQAPARGKAAAQLVSQDYERVVGSLGTGTTKMRALQMEDFRCARKCVAPSVEAEGESIAELRRWSEKFGDGSSRRSAADPKLSYFL